MANKKVSIIVPVYNVEQYLNKCIDSIISQTYKDIEVILINDGSKDSSGEICDKYAKKDLRIVVVHKENGGVSSARNKGLEVSTGDFIMFVDSDDWIEADAISSLMEIQNEINYDVIMFGIHRENIILGNITATDFIAQSFNDIDKIKEVLPNLIKQERTNSLWSKIYKASIIKDNNISFNEFLSIAEDALFNYEVFFKIRSLYISEKCLYHYMIRDVESLTKRYNPLKYEMLMAANDYLHNAIKENEHSKEILCSAQYIRIKNIYSCFLDLFASSCPLTIKEKKSYIKNILEKEVLKNNDNNYQIEDKSYRALKFILYTKSVNLIYFIVYIMFMIRK
ncbi:glycosyltransferase family 2 protein [Alkalibacter saccharofermentans]|uniref:Glycosyl transferase family 2 n=1 Tax=Alkalibacter saccharofermentans DSM 14828 TaxID=1120975 RepID=A0A1M4ZVC5_9FIRM|nr:glycosyltransferase [Alkalibacter saccharofermentans]SHF22030.1 Glycosyl transferase family 2 [Alkalibacter saccharofermentans DSM 14828]